MKKQYMDFVPTKQKSAKTTETKAKRSNKATQSTKATRPVQATRLAGETTVVKSTQSAQKAVSTRPTQSTQPKANQTITFATEKKTILGTVENLNTKFVKSDVPKRPLSQKPHFITKKTGLAAVKAQRISNRKPETKAEKPVVKSTQTSGDKRAYKTPNTPFINQNKVKKRPLSKNIYTKKVTAPKEESKGPITIISKPEKQAHIGLIITIILTIILGAAAGTVAFLLLPK